MINKKHINWISIIPLITIVLFALFCLRVSYQLGENSTFTDSDPKDFDFNMHHILIWFFGIVSIIIIPLVLTYDAITRNFTVETLIKRIAIVVFLAILFFNPFDLVDWFLN